MTTYIGTDLNDRKDVTGDQHAAGLEGNDNLDDGYNGPGETLEGNSDNDYLFFYNSAAGSIYGGNDNDALLGASGSDYLEGGSSNDYLDGNYVSETNADNDELYGGGGTDGYMEEAVTTSFMAAMEATRARSKLPTVALTQRIR